MKTKTRNLERSATFQCSLLSVSSDVKKEIKSKKYGHHVPLFGGFYFDSLTLLYSFDLFLGARTEILTKISLGLWEI